MFLHYTLVLIIAGYKHVIANNNKSIILTSPYSNVHVWHGRLQLPPENNKMNEHTFWRPRTHSPVITGKNVPFNKEVSNIDVILQSETNPRRGDVIQKRFIPRPWFGYETNVNKTSVATLLNGNRPQLEYVTPVPFDSFPLPLRITPDAFINKDNKPTEASGEVKPAKTNNEPTSSNMHNNLYVTYPPFTDKIPGMYAPATDTLVTDSYEYFQHHDMEKPDMMPPSGPHVHNETMGSDMEKPPKMEEQYHDFPSYLEHDPDPHAHGYGFDHYFHHDHYHEITTTTTPKPEDERVNKRPYSYYYLGRKLWYIPLYFSVYFIIYIFLLILKSIARHKITFNQYFEVDKREMNNEYKSEDLHNHVHNQIQAARRKYLI